MTTYHLSPKTHSYQVCTATQGKCPYGAGNHISAESYTALTSREIYKREQNNNPIIALKNNGNYVANAKVAPEGITGLYCYDCNQYFDNELSQELINLGSGETTSCPNCGAEAYVEGVGVDIRKLDSKFLADSKVREASWFHVTSTPDWLDKVRESGEEHEEDTPLVHIGSREAAMDRLRDLRKWRGKNTKGAVWYLYEVKVRPSARIAEGLFYDENDDCPATQGDAENTKYDSKGVTRYLNIYEAPGTVSLVANPNAIEVKQCLEVPLD